MPSLRIQLPEPVQKKIQEWADAKGTSVEEFVSAAAAEKLEALLALDYLQERAKRASRKKFEAVLEMVSDAKPPNYDRLPKQFPAQHDKRQKRLRTGKNSRKSS